MQLYGYSERGVLNTLFNEIAYSETPEALLLGMLNVAVFPRRQDKLKSVTKASILLEQSLSDFGDADAITLLETAEGSTTVFIEAKVKSSQASGWTIQGEYQKFTGGLASKVGSSNLFTQLYHKVRFVTALKHGGLNSLCDGVPFPPSSTRPIRKIGGNKVVLRAVNLISPHIGNVRYLAVVPDSPDPVRAFFEFTLSESGPAGYDGWDIQDYGCICWPQIEEFCRVEGLVNSLRVFDFNRGQIY